ncbi:uncharacterized protein PG998_011186 [Apiospora kogelbergensis]|uniref:uncharacterized protein n=1 Tax=Apiospora kogelbergensis TaxID=1337665 RepID=UPI0031316B80
MPEFLELVHSNSSGGARHKRRRGRISAAASSWTGRLRRRLQHNTQSTLTQQSNCYEVAVGHSSSQEVAENNTAWESAGASVDSSAAIEDSREDESQVLKPWETLVVGANLGSNLSRIEYKDREILQQEYIVSWHEKHQPSAAQHQITVLAKLVEERAKMRDTHENTTSIEELRMERAIAGRLSTLRKELESDRCDAESANIRAAIAGYESGQIVCSEQFTLIYDGHIVDTCPSYSSFCVDREERLDRYSQQYGSGWLWHEPPLVGGGNSSNIGAEVHAKKGFCLYQIQHNKYEGFGVWPISMRFVTSEDKVRRANASTAKPIAKGRKRKRRNDDAQEEKNSTPLKPCTFKMMLDTGATFPMLRAGDLTRLGIDPDTYAAQGVIPVATSNGTVPMRLYELYVGIGSALVSGAETGSESTYETGFPLEKGAVGGLCPVLVSGLTEDEDEEYPDQLWETRLSGIMPFKACYVSSVPTAGRIWMGENRRDVLGASECLHIADSVLFMWWTLDIHPTCMMFTML